MYLCNCSNCTCVYVWIEKKKKFVILSKCQTEFTEHTEFKKYMQCFFRAVLILCICWYCLVDIPQVINKGFYKWIVGQNPSHQESYGSILNHLDLLYQIVFLYLKQTEFNNKTNLEDWIKFQKSERQIPWDQIPFSWKKKTWRKTTDFKLTSWLSNKSFLNTVFFTKFYEISTFFFYPFKHQKQFSYQKFFENNRKKSKFARHIHIQSTLKWSRGKVHFIAVRMKKATFDFVRMLRNDCLLKIFSQKNIGRRN